MVESYETTTLRMNAPAPCALIQDLLPLYLEGEVSTLSTNYIVEHLASCERCAGFLAGAQSVRGQFAAERRARNAVHVAAQPERRTLMRWRAVLAAAAAFIICAIGGVASGLLGSGQDEQTIVGIGLGGMALGALMLLARIIGPLHAPRLGRLLTSVGTGVLAGVVLGGTQSSDGVLISGFLLAFVATGMVCFQIAREAARPAAVSS